MVNSPEIGEPLDELGGVASVEFDVGEVDFDDGGGRVPAIEEHQLGLSEMHWGQN